MIVHICIARVCVKLVLYIKQMHCVCTYCSWTMALNSCICLVCAFACHHVWCHVVLRAVDGSVAACPADALRLCYIHEHAQWPNVVPPMGPYLHRASSTSHVMKQIIRIQSKIELVGREVCDWELSPVHIWMYDWPGYRMCLLIIQSPQVLPIMMLTQKCHTSLS